MTPVFRADIQIVRGGAILFVFLFHLLPTYVPSGFLGVDVFFALSGFLMSAIYDSSSRDSIRRFYFNRARRILPAYFTVLLFVVAAAIVLTLPHELEDIIRHALYSAFLVPNIGYWLDGSYFDKTIYRPALHFWSLGVELQFYLLVPIIVALYIGRRRLLAAITVASFVACIMIVGLRPRYAFYLVPFRLWEFLLGFYAFKLTQLVPLSGKKHIWHWFAFMLCIGIAVAMFVPLEETDHPKYQAAFVTIATAAILVAGLPAAVVLSWAGRAMVVVGKYSYSIYLVHFVVITFWFYQPFSSRGPIVATPKDVAVVLGLTTLASILLFHAVETPLRKMASARAFFVVHAGVILSIFSLIGAAKLLQHQMLPEAVFQISAGWSDRGPERCGKFAMLLNDLSQSCSLTTNAIPGAPKYVLVGDSHADAIKDVMAEVASRHRVDFHLFRENCVLGTGGCAVENLANFAGENSVSTIILHAAPGAMRGDELRRVLENGLSKNFKVVVIDPVPVWSGNVLHGLYDEQLGLKPAWLSQTIDDYRYANADYLQQMEQFSGSNLTRHSPASLLCLPDCPPASPTGKPYYFDGGHLTKTGARRLTTIFEDIFRLK